MKIALKKRSGSRQREILAAIVLLFLVLTLLVVLKRNIVDSYLKNALEKFLSFELKTKVSIDGFDISILSLSVDGKGVWLEGIAGGESNFYADDIKVYLSPFPIFLRRVVIPRVEISGAIIGTSFREIDTFNVTKVFPAKRGRRIINFEVGNISVNDLKMVVSLDNTTKLLINLENAESNLKSRPGTLNFTGNAVLTTGSGEYKLGAISSKLSFAAGALIVDRFTASSGKEFTFGFGGSVSPKLSIDGRLEGNTEFFRNASPFMKKVRGRFDMPFKIGGKTSDPKFEGSIKSDRVLIGDLEIKKIDFSLAGGKGSVAVKKGELKSGETKINLNGQINLKKRGNAAFRIDFSRIKLAEVVAKAADVSGIPDGLLSGNATIDITDLEKLGLSATLDAVLENFNGKYGENNKDSFPLFSFAFAKQLTLKGLFEYSDGEPLVIKTIEILNGNFSASLKGKILNRAGSVEYSLESDGLDYAMLRGRPLSGRLSLAGDIGFGKGPLAGAGSVRVEKFAVGQEPVGDFNGNFKFDSSQFEITRYSLQGKTGGVSGSLATTYEKTPHVIVNSDFSKFSAGWMFETFFSKGSVPSNISTDLTGKINLEGPVNALTGFLEISADGIFLYQNNLGNLKARLDFRNGRIDIGSLIADKGNAEILRGYGYYNGAGDAKIALTGRDLSIDAFDFLRIKKFFGESLIDFSLNFEGVGDKKNLYGNLSLREKNKGAIDTVILESTFSTDLKKAKIEGSYSQKALSYSIDVDLGGGMPTEIKFSSLNFNFVPLLAKKMTLNSDKLKGDITMEGAFSGNLKGRSFLKGAVTISHLQLMKDDFNLYNSSPLSFTVEDGNYNIKPFTLSGTETELNLEGRGTLGGANSLKLKGYCAFNLISVFIEEITRGEGRVDLEAALEGPFSNPQLIGTGKITDAVFVERDFPNVIQSINADLTFSHRKIFLDNLRAEMGGGTIRGDGSMELGDFDGGIYFDAKVQLSEVSSLFPPDFPATVSGILTFKGPYRVPTLGGELEVRKMQYSVPWDWRTKLVSFNVARYTPGISKGAEIYLNLKIKAPTDTIELRNNVADARLHGDLRLSGDDKNIGLLGMVGVDRGKVFFLENEFELTEGTIKFVDDRKILALFDVSAKTAVNNVDIFLNLRGTSDKPEVFLSSRPAKSETDIVSLLTLGIESSEMTTGGGAQTGLSQSVVTSVLTGALQSSVEKTFRRSKIIDTFQVYPSFSEDTRTTELRVVVGKEIPYDMTILYSTDVNNIGKNQEVKVNKGILNNLAIQGVLKEKSDQRVDLGLDFEYKLDF